MYSNVFISLGSNIGDRLFYINSAMKQIAKIDSVKIIGKSCVMETDPVGVTGQDKYLNQIFLIETDIAPQGLLCNFKSIEQKLGRVKREHWAEREIDIDIISYSDIILEESGLFIPHRQILNRFFILNGCVQIMPDYIVLPFKKTVRELYENLDDSVKAQKVRVFTS